MKHEWSQMYRRALSLDTIFSQLTAHNIEGAISAISCLSFAYVLVALSVYVLIAFLILFSFSFRITKTEAKTEALNTYTYDMTYYPIRWVYTSMCIISIFISGPQIIISTFNDFRKAFSSKMWWIIFFDLAYNGLRKNSDEICIIWLHYL